VDSEKYKYYYDNADNISRKDETVSGTLKTTNYTYDNMNRLWTVLETLSENTTKTTTYTYDSRGNRDTMTISITGSSPSTTYTKYDYRANNSLRAETIRNGGSTGTIKQVKEYKHDGNGNLLSIYDAYQRKFISVNTYTYLNELDTSMVGTNTIFNTYNAEGQRVKKTLNAGAPERYFYEGDKVVFQYANNNSITAFNVIGTNLISRKIGTTKVYYFYNGHGDVTALLDASTNKTRARYAYDAFGNITREDHYDSNGNLTNNPANMIKSQVRFGEYQYDSETEYKDASNNTVTGLYYLNARHYDPGMARFLEVDTYTGELNDPLSLNLYTYCHNEPLMYSDPSGHYEGERLSWVPGVTDRGKPNADVAEFQKDLLYLGNYFKEKVYDNEIGYFGEKTFNAVSNYKNKFLEDGNKGNNEGVVGPQTWAYIKWQVGLKSASTQSGPAYDIALAKAKSDFKAALDKLVKPKATVQSTSGNAYKNGTRSSINTPTATVKPTVTATVKPTVTPTPLVATDDGNPFRQFFSPEVWDVMNQIADGAIFFAAAYGNPAEPKPITNAKGNEGFQSTNKGKGFYEGAGIKILNKYQKSIATKLLNPNSSTILQKGEKITVQDISMISRAYGDELALVQRVDGSRVLYRGINNKVSYPLKKGEKSILHTHATDIIPSNADINALLNVGQNSELIVTFYKVEKGYYMKVGKYDVSGNYKLIKEESIK